LISAGSHPALPQALLKAEIQSLYLNKIWRRERDSNPRSGV
jgi:hypothetical protein